MIFPDIADDDELRIVVPENWELLVGDSRTVECVFDEKITDRKLEWSVEPADVACVDKWGRVTALKAGEAGGETTIYPTTNPNVLVISRELGEENIVYIANISNEEVRFHFEEEAPQGEFENYFTKEKVLLPAGFKLAPWDFLLLTK
jgi:hypothetical protein